MPRTLVMVLCLVSHPIKESNIQDVFGSSDRFQLPSLVHLLIKVTESVLIKD